MKRNTGPLIPMDKSLIRSNTTACADKELFSILNCENLPVSKWWKYIEDNDPDHNQLRQYHSDEEYGDNKDMQKRRKLGKRAR